MTAETKNGQCVALRSAEPADLAGVLALLDRANLPVAGVADSLPHFVIAEDGGQLVGVVGLEMYGPSALLRSAAVEENTLSALRLCLREPRLGGWGGSGVG